MGRNLVICCDGTGNEFGTHNTNVVEVFSALDKTDRTRQIAYYNPGVGTMSAPGLQTPLAKLVSKGLGLAFGRGMTRNIEDAYIYLMNNYQPGDQIFIFGFSRGAYTVRALTGMLHKMGLLEKGSDNLVPYAVRLYRKHPKTDEEWKIVRGFAKNFGRECKPHFIGVWDTVKSVGWFRRRVTLDFTFKNPDMKHGRHAVSIDEKRTQYRTNLWGHLNSDDVQEVWFSGVHSDVGGSYAERGLSDITLKWMLEAARHYGLLIEQAALDALHPDPMGKLHNPLWPFWWLLGWKQRIIRKLQFPASQPPAEVWIHESVQQRMQGSGGSYRPNIPPNARFVP